MMRLTSLLLVLAPLVSGFGFPQKARHLKALGVSQADPTWSEYQHDFIDPITPHETPSGLHEPDPQQRAIADEFWLKQFEDYKEKLHEMMAKQETTTSPLFATDASWDHYKHEFIDPKKQASE